MSNPSHVPPKPTSNHVPPKPSSKNPRWSGPRIAALVAAIVVAFCCAGSVILPRVAQRVMGAIDSAVAPARDAAGGYLYALRAGDYPAAYGQLCEEARKATSLETFTQAQSARPLVRYEILGTQIQNRNGRSSATVTAKLSYSDQGSSTQLISLVEEDGGWRVCG